MKKILLFLILLGVTIPAEAKTVDFDYVLNQSIEKSYRINMSKIETKISDKGIKEAKSEYYPQINAYFTAEHLDSLDPNSSQTYVGSDFLSGSDRYQSAVSLGVSYNVFDFGIRKRKVDIAKVDKKQKEITSDRELRDLKLHLVEVYGDALLLSKKYEITKELLAIQVELYKMQDRLNEAGKVRKTDVISNAIEVAELTSQSNDIKHDYANTLKELSFFAQEPFDIESVELKDFEPNKNEEGNIINVSYKQMESDLISGVGADEFLVENSLESKIYDLEIQKKKKELEILKRKRLPNFQFDTRYYLYGMNKDDMFKSMGELSERSLNFRLVGSLPIFDGFKLTAQQQKTALEIERMQVAKDQALAELDKKYTQVVQDSITTAENLEQSYATLNLVNENIEMIEQLKDNKLIDRADYLNQKAELLSKKLTLEENKVGGFIAQYKMDVLKGIEKQ